MAGVIFPMVMVGWLALRMNRKPALPPNRVGLILAFNFMLPVGLVLLGLEPHVARVRRGKLGPAWVDDGVGGAAVVLVILGVSRGRRADQ